jgi:hypothetical protein
MSLPDPSDDLIPGLREWNYGEGLSIENWLSAIGNYQHAIAYAHLFWPQFIEYRGAILLASRFDQQNFNNWVEYTKGNLSAAEEITNRTHILDLFPDADLVPSPAQVRYLGNVLREMWQAKLAHDFPDRTVTVRFDESESPDDLLENVITFYQEPLNLPPGVAP